MDSAMQLDATTILPSTRKRSIRQREVESEDEDTSIDRWDGTPFKRLRDKQGAAVGRRVLRYNTKNLLNHLAFTQLYVTANFRNYNPSSSPIILIFVSTIGISYRILHRILPSLYHVAPSLQALALTSMPLEQLEGGDEADTRILPIKCICDMDESIASNIEDFRQALSNPDDCIVVVNASGTCVWTNDELDVHQDTSPEPDFCEAMTSALRRVLMTSSEGDTMDIG